MASSVTDAGNPQGGKKSKDKNKNLVVLVDERLAEITDSTATLTGRMDDIEKHLEELESTEDFEEIHGEVRAAINSIVVNVNQEVQTLRASKAAKEEEFKDCRAQVEASKSRVEASEAQLKVRMAAVANMGLVAQAKYPPPQREMHSKPQLIMGQGM